MDRDSDYSNTRVHAGIKKLITETPGAADMNAVIRKFGYDSPEANQFLESCKSTQEQVGVYLQTQLVDESSSLSLAVEQAHEIGLWPISQGKNLQLEKILFAIMLADNADDWSKVVNTLGYSENLDQRLFQHGALNQFLEHFPDALAEIEEKMHAQFPEEPEVLVSQFLKDRDKKQDTRRIQICFEGYCFACHETTSIQTLNHPRLKARGLLPKMDTKTKHSVHFFMQKTILDYRKKIASNALMMATLAPVCIRRALYKSLLVTNISFASARVNTTSAAARALLFSTPAATKASYSSIVVTVILKILYHHKNHKYN